MGAVAMCFVSLQPIPICLATHPIANQPRFLSPPRRFISREPLPTLPPVSDHTLPRRRCKSLTVHAGFPMQRMNGFTPRRRKRGVQARRHRECSSAAKHREAHSLFQELVEASARVEESEHAREMNVAMARRMMQAAESEPTREINEAVARRMLRKTPLHRQHEGSTTMLLNGLVPGRLFKQAENDIAAMSQKNRVNHGVMAGALEIAKYGAMSNAHSQQAQSHNDTDVSQPDCALAVPDQSLAVPDQSPKDAEISEVRLQKHSALRATESKVQAIVQAAEEAKRYAPVNAERRTLSDMTRCTAPTLSDLARSKSCNDTHELGADWDPQPWETESSCNGD